MIKKAMSPSLKPDLIVILPTPTAILIRKSKPKAPSFQPSKMAVPGQAQPFAQTQFSRRYTTGLHRQNQGRVLPRCLRQLRAQLGQKKGKPSYKTPSGRYVYGGGITPDVWVENDDNVLSENLRQIFYSEKRHFYAFVDEIMRKNPQVSQSTNDFVSNFVVTERMFLDLVKFVYRNEPQFSGPGFYPR